ncbi:MAG: prolipoprotein diacylglyceryl transferase family protein [Alphaproteobacteria bacterium]
MIATDRALALVAIWAFLSIGALVARRTHRPASRVAWIALLVGILAARTGFVLANLSAFAVEPWSILAVWQGGFAPWVGVAGAAMAVVVMLGRQRASGYLLGALAGLSIAHAAASAATTPDPRPFPAGVTLKTMQGGVLSIDALRGRPFVLNLWATWCPPCRREMPMVIDVAGQSTTPILLVNQGEPAGRVNAFLSINDLASDAIVIDEAQHVAAAGGASAYPTTLFFDADGNVVRRHAGEISRAALTAAIRDLERTKS